MGDCNNPLERVKPSKSKKEDGILPKKRRCSRSVMGGALMAKGFKGRITIPMNKLDEDREQAHCERDASSSQEVLPVLG